MVYNIDLEAKIDKLTNRLGDITKKRMFGGLGYLLNGNMCFGIYREYLVLRTAPEKAAELLQEDDTKPFDITGRPMKGWLMVSPDAVETEDRLLAMLQIGVSYAETLAIK